MGRVGSPKRRATDLLKLRFGGKHNLATPEKSGLRNQQGLQQGSVPCAQVFQRAGGNEPQTVTSSHPSFPGLLSLAANTAKLDAQYIMVK